MLNSRTELWTTGSYRRMSGILATISSRYLLSSSTKMFLSRKLYEVLKLRIDTRYAYVGSISVNEPSNLPDYRMSST